MRNGVYRLGALVAGLTVVLTVVLTATVGPVLPAAPAYAVPGNIECGQAFTETLTHVPWPLKWLQPQRAWPLSRGQGVVVAVIDSGISGEHPKLRNQLLPGLNMVPTTEKACDNTHGTLVAAIIAARDDTAEQTYYGIAPDAKILPIRVLPDMNENSDPQMPKRIGDAIRYAVDHGAGVINLSLHTDPTDYLQQQVNYALAHNVVVVAAAGNVTPGASATAPAYPAAYPGVIAVAGIDENGKHADTSISGNYVSVAAPGVKIEGPGPRGPGYGLDDGGGTSFAAAYVSGTAALLRGYLPNASVAQIKRRMEVTADAPPDGWDPQVGYGVINPYRALGTILDSRTSVRLATPSPVPVQHVPTDPLATAKRVAAWVAPLGILVAVLLLMVRPVLRRGRARKWRTGSTG